jgi:hypothetical protein
MRIKAITREVLLRELDRLTETRWDISTSIPLNPTSFGDRVWARAGECATHRLSSSASSCVNFLSSSSSERAAISDLRETSALTNCSNVGRGGLPWISNQHGAITFA